MHLKLWRLSLKKKIRSSALPTQRDQLVIQHVCSHVEALGWKGRAQILERAMIMVYPLVMVYPLSALRVSQVLPVSLP